jgi:hypothetical protein
MREVPQSILSDMCRHFVKTTNSKHWAKQEDEWSPPPVGQRQTAHQAAHNGGNCNNGVDYSHSSTYSPDLAPCNFHLFGPLKDSLQLFCRQQWAGTECVWRTPMCQHIFMRLAYSIWCNCGKSKLIMKETWWKSSLNFVKNVSMVYVNFCIIVISFCEKQEAILSYRPLYVMPLEANPLS